jgi:hypothetical protein
MATGFDKGERILLKIAGISAAVIAITNLYAFYRSNVWHPKVEVKKVDFKSGVADLIVNGKPVTIKGDSNLDIHSKEMAKECMIVLKY